MAQLRYLLHEENPFFKTGKNLCLVHVHERSAATVSHKSLPLCSASINLAIHFYFSGFSFLHHLLHILVRRVHKINVSHRKTHLKFAVCQNCEDEEFN